MKPLFCFHLKEIIVDIALLDKGNIGHFRKKQHGLTESMREAAQRAVDAGIKVVAFDVNVENDAAAYAKGLAEQLLFENPLLVKAHLILAECLMALDDEAAAVEHIHQAASLDPGGEVARRIWGSDQPYRGAWPAAQVPGAAGPLPHPVAAALCRAFYREGHKVAPFKAHCQ